MKREDIQHLATLSRIALSDSEADALAGVITAVLDYVSEINDITADVADTKEVGPLNTVMREDGAPHEPGVYTDALLDAAPRREGAHIRVKKILDTDA